MKNILIVEDDKDIVKLVHIHLKDIHCTLDKADTGTTGIRMALNKIYDLIILDIMLPDIDGIEICKKLRDLHISFPIMMLTARSEESDKINGLETGADDYLTKPFSIKEFVARIKAMLRRNDLNLEVTAKNSEIFSCGDMIVDGQRRKVTIDKNKIELTAKEFDLLYLFITNPGKSFSRDDLLNEVWGYEFNGYEHTVNSHINRLRSKIEPDMRNPKYILTTWGIGYQFTDEIKTHAQNQIQ
ncbi:MAG TPA: response regulator transcription factor [Puia sp.]|nr:response regulator transcription factor [Puia sp.]